MNVDVLAAFAERRATLADRIESLAEILDGAPAALGVGDALRAGAARARADRFRIVLLGAFSTGKSTLLNAVIGRAVLPARINPCTAIPTEVRFGETPGVTVFRTDGPPEDLTIEAFHREFLLSAADAAGAGEEATDRFGHIAGAELRVPLDLLRRGVILVDTPGLDDDPQRTARTMATLPDADAVIVVLNALRFLGDLERRMLRDHLRPLGLTTLFFPVTMADLLPRVSAHPEADLARIQEEAERELGLLCEKDLHTRLFPLDARGALAARVGGTPVPADFERFESSLATFLVHERGDAQLERLRGLALHARAELGRHAAMDRASLASTAEELEARQEALRPRFEELEQIVSRVAHLVDGFIEREKTRIWLDLRAHIVRCQRTLPDAIARMELPGLNGVELLTPAGRARAEAELQAALEDWFHTQLDDWRTNLEGTLDQSLHGLRAELATEAQEFHVLASDILEAFAGAEVSLPRARAAARTMDPVERWFSVAVGAALLSPGTVAAAWNDGYEGALKGAAGRLGARVTLLAATALLGPVGWASFALYAAVDLVLVLRTGGGQLRRLRKSFADQVGDSLVAHVDAQRNAIEAQVASALEPMRDHTAAAARAEIDELAALLEHITEARKQADGDAASRTEQWRAVTTAAEALLEDIERR